MVDRVLGKNRTRVRFSFSAPNFGSIVQLVERSFHKRRGCWFESNWSYHFKVSSFMDIDSNHVSKEQFDKAQTLINAFREQQPTPKALDEPINYSRLKEAAIRYIELLQNGKIGNDDFKEEIFVEAIEAVFGESVWTWVREHIKLDSGQDSRHLKRYLGKK